METVRYSDTTRKIKIGPYASTAQHLVPQVEAPIRDLRSPQGWRIIISALLDHDKGSMSLVAHFWRGGTATGKSHPLLMVLDDSAVKSFGRVGDVFVATTSEEHAYNTQTTIWLLPPTGDAKEVLQLRGVFRRFNDRSVPSIVVGRQTYDGVDAKTKGLVDEFYKWDVSSQRLVQSQR